MARGDNDTEDLMDEDVTMVVGGGGGDDMTDVEVGVTLQPSVAAPAGRRKSSSGGGRGGSRKSSSRAQEQQRRITQEPPRQDRARRRPVDRANPHRDLASSASAGASRRCRAKGVRRELTQERGWRARCR